MTGGMPTPEHPSAGLAESDPNGDGAVLGVLTAATLVPVVVLEEAAKAVGLVSALATGGLPCAEITLRTPSALSAIEAAAQVPDVVVGAGTVLTVGQAKDAIAAGARFLVSPGLNLEVVTLARDAGVLAIPGAITPTEVMAALAAGVRTLKFFPAQTSGGPAAIKALAAPFPMLRFMPTGGITADNLADYLAIPAVVAVGGSWVAPAHLVDAGDLAAVTEVSAQAVALIRSLRGR